MNHAMRFFVIFVLSSVLFVFPCVPVERAGASDGTNPIGLENISSSMIKLPGDEFLGVLWTADASKVVTRHSKSYRFWDIETSTCVLTIEPPDVNMALIDVVAEANTALLMLEEPKGTVLIRLNLQSGEATRALTFSRSTRVSNWFCQNGLKVLTEDGSISRIWQAQSGDCLLALTPDEGDRARVEDVSADGKFLAVTRYESDSQSAFVEVLDLNTGDRIANTEPVTSNLVRARFSPDGKKLATLSRTQATVWDVKTSNRLATFLHHDETTRSLGSASDNRPFGRGHVHQPFDRDGKRLLTKSGVRSAKLWSIATGECLAEFKHPDIPTTQLDSAFFSVDGSKLLTLVSSREHRHHRITKVWCVDTVECLLTLRNDIGRISPDGSKVARLKNGELLEILQFNFLPYREE